MLFKQKAIAYLGVACMGLAAAILSANGTSHAAEHGKKGDKEHGKEAAAAPKVEKAIAVLTPTEGNKATGIVTFTKVQGGIKIEAKLSNLAPDAEHGFHIHEFGDLSSADGTAMGGHFNPHGAAHGAPDAEERHAGDFGNVKSDADGNATYERVDKHIKMNGPASILGHGMILHQNRDDLETQPTGDAGPRIAQGIIGVAKSE